MLAAGSTIGGRYRLISLIGEGGMASVWRAHDDTLKRSVAIKVLYLRVHGQPQATIDQFLREARIAAAVQHRNVIQTVDFGTDAAGTPYMVMELLHGENLAARLDRAPPLSVEELVQLTELTLRGLSAVHEAGIVHRDLKPQNIFLQRDADAVYPKILDFGISRSLTSSELPSPVATQQGIVIGTPHYMAPEQARGETNIDKRADIYSMGAILYEGITGRLPFDAPTPGELLVKIITSEPTPLSKLRPDIPEVLTHCVMQAMAHDREHRYVDAKAFRQALTLAAQRAFPKTNLTRVSGLPARQDHEEPHHDAAHRGGVDTPDTSGQNWGDFEGLAQRSRSARAPEPRVSASPVRSPLPAAAAARGHGFSAVARESVARGRVSRTAPDESAFSAGEPLLGDNPLDVFASSNAVALELDVDFSAGAAANAQSQRRSIGAAKRQPSTQAAGSSVHANGVTGVVGQRSSTAAPRRRVSAVWWIVPASVFVLVTVFLLQPGLVSVAPPDQAAARQREAQNPATRGSSQTLVRKPRSHSAGLHDPDGLPPSLRELLE